MLGLFRLMLALLALGVALAGPAAATQAMAGRAMPCHEAALADVPPAPLASFAVALAVSDAGTLPQPMVGHLCCVLGHLVVVPLAAPTLQPPEAHRAVRAIPTGRALLGVAPPTPVPPPRFL
ncbi:hypothetical protein [Ancylobacter sp.]|uniref:hypothetical protein n=1 Tax=Ancylobacter sp. TaxID=1872567 RepID=UPI003D1189CD